MTPPELRITDAEVAEVRRGPMCRRCNGCGGYLGACLGFICCEDCGGDGYWTLLGDLPPLDNGRDDAVGADPFPARVSIPIPRHAPPRRPRPTSYEVVPMHPKPPKPPSGPPPDDRRRAREEARQARRDDRPRRGRR